ncbi:hypothetical protein J6590_024165 [Homalodisca vitripennis]|nr:hypothetical protein J6590_024165 [Homalodisca vitripennis]
MSCVPEGGRGAVQLLHIIRPSALQPTEPGAALRAGPVGTRADLSNSIGKFANPLWPMKGNRFTRKMANAGRKITKTDPTIYGQRSVTTGGRHCAFVSYIRSQVARLGTDHVQLPPCALPLFRRPALTAKNLEGHVNLEIGPWKTEEVRRRRCRTLPTLAERCRRSQSAC